jgi:GYF domain 2
MPWFVWQDGTRVGPLTDAELRARVESGAITARHAVCRAGSTKWTPVGMVPELARVGCAAEAGPAPEITRHGEAADGASRISDSSPVRGSYFLRHWRGDLSLPASYWVNGVLASLVLATVGVAVAAFVDFSSAPRISSAAILALWFVALLFIAWQVIGVWRSAGKHGSRGGSPLWASAARAAVVLGAVQVGTVVMTRAAPQMWEFAVMLTDHDPNHGYHLRLARDASEIEISGYIAFGLTAGVKAHLDRHPGVKIVRLTSSGGRVAEARKLRDLIALRHLSTFTSTQCTSACVIPFLAGESRVIVPGAVIGFHQYTVAGIASRYTRRDMEKDKAYFISRGVSPAFVARAFRPTSVLWRPTPEQMLAAGFITDYADGGDDTVTLNDIDTLDEKLRHDPAYAAIAESDPAAFASIVAVAKDGFRRGQSITELRTRTSAIVEQLYAKRLASASDEAEMSFARLMLDRLAILQEDPGSCVAFLAQGNHGPAIPALISTEMQNRERDVMTAVIRSGASGQWRPPEAAEVLPIRAEVTARLLETFSREDLAELAQVDRPGANAARACEVSRGLYRVIVDLPAEKAGSMLRDMFARRATPGP